MFSGCRIVQNWLYVDRLSMAGYLELCRLEAAAYSAPQLEKLAV